MTLANPKELGLRNATKIKTLSKSMFGNRMDESESELRRRVTQDIEADAVAVEMDEGETEISLFYHEPSTKTKPVKTPLGLMLAVVEPDPEKLLARAVDEIYATTSPDEMDIEDKNGFYVVTLEYDDGNTW